MTPHDCDHERLPPDLRALFRPLPRDPVIDAFVAGPLDPRWRSAARDLLRRVITDFDADGWLGTCPMALFGPRAWEDLVDRRRGGRLLDVGAGAGHVTEHARGLFARIEATERSRPLARRLRARGFVVHDLDLADERVPGARFDVVALLNVLDRTARPRSILRGCVESLAPGGALIVSVPLPVRPHVDVGARTVDPDEPLDGRGDSFEEALVDLVRGTIEPTGLRIERLARASYLSRGQRLVALDAGVIVASADRK